MEEWHNEEKAITKDMPEEIHEINTENINTTIMKSRVNPVKEMTSNVEFSENAEEKCSQQSVELITSLPATATNNVRPFSSINILEIRLFVSELSWKNLPINTSACSGTAYK